MAPLDRKVAAAEANNLASFQPEHADRRISGGFYFAKRGDQFQPHVTPVSTGFALQALAMWRLYQVAWDGDWTQYTDVKDKNPDKLKELQDLFVAEASKNNIFPLNNSPLAINPRTSLICDRSTTVYRPGIVALDTYDTPNVLSLTADVSADTHCGSITEYLCSRTTSS